MSRIQGIGDVIAGTFTEYFQDPEKRARYENLLKEVHLQKEERQEQQSFAGINFVITGSVTHFKNRNEVKEEIEKRGGKVTGSITSKTNDLINNDKESTSPKNRTAKEIGVQMISNEDFLVIRQTWGKKWDNM